MELIALIALVGAIILLAGIKVLRVVAPKTRTTKDDKALDYLEPLEKPAQNYVDSKTKR